jgi:CheY-like chemotaxis protein
MNPEILNLLLADDDRDDCIFFREALEELSIPTHLVTVSDGTELMRLLKLKETILPDVLFLDLNMPIKNGFDSLTEIKLDEDLNHIPVIIFSTSYDSDIAYRLHQSGAKYYIRKPPDFSDLKKIIYKSLSLIWANRDEQTPKENFLIKVEE